MPFDRPAGFVTTTGRARPYAGDLTIRHNAEVDHYSAAERRGRAAALIDRDGERGVLDRLVSAVRAGESRVLVMRGDPGVGKTVLRDDHARALLDSAVAGPLDARVRDLIVAETRGNPLALLELPRGLTPAGLAGGFGLPAATPLTGRIEASFGRQLSALPHQTNSASPRAASCAPRWTISRWTALRARPGRTMNEGQ
jgi:hypothetical protein